MAFVAAVFDVDGVLVDSLPAHLEMCARLSREYGLGLEIPSSAEFRALVRRGVPVSPMQSFFEAVGFSPELARRADAEYEATFSARFSPAPFNGVADMLARLRKRGVEVGIVSSNTRRNVEQALGGLASHFPNGRVFTRDHAQSATKAEALRALVRELGDPPEQICYVGDQPADARAAFEAGLPFIGVTYGWGISTGDELECAKPTGCQLADTPAAVADVILK